MCLIQIVMNYYPTCYKNCILLYYQLSSETVLSKVMVINYCCYVGRKPIIIFHWAGTFLIKDYVSFVGGKQFLH